MGILDKILGKSEATEATNTSTMARGQAGAPHMPAESGHPSHGVQTQSPHAPGSDKTVAGLADSQHSYPLGHGGALGKDAKHTMTSNFGGAQTGDFGGATGNPRPEYNDNVGLVGSHTHTHGSGIEGGSGLSGAAAGGVASGTNKHHDGIAVLGSGAPTGMTGSGYSHDHTGPDCVHDSHRTSTRQYDHDHSGDNCGHVSHHDHTGDNCQHVSHGHQSHSHGHSHTHGSSTTGQALFDSGANSTVGGAIIGRNKEVGDLGHHTDETNTVPGRAEGGGIDGHGEGWHDRKMGAEMGNFYKGSQPGQ